MSCAAGALLLDVSIKADCLQETGYCRIRIVFDYRDSLDGRGPAHLELDAGNITVGNVKPDRLAVGGVILTRRKCVHRVMAGA